MPVNRDKSERWKADIAESVDMYNKWFMEFAPKAFRETRGKTTKEVESALAWTNNLTDIKQTVLREHPEVLPMLRMSTCPPIARDRLIGLSGVSPTIVHAMELEHRIPQRLNPQRLREELDRIGAVLEKMADPDIFVWLGRAQPVTEAEIHRAAETSDRGDHQTI